ncbi:hypothetical protein [Candidatus Pantoea floridensis]
MWLKATIFLGGSRFCRNKFANRSQEDPARSLRFTPQPV